MKALRVYRVLWACLAFSVVGCASQPSRMSALPGQPFTRHESGGGGPTWYLAAEPGGPRPLLVLIQGSGCEPLFVDSSGNMKATAGQDLVFGLASGRFAVLVVEKPGASVPATGETGTAGGCSEEFRRRHSLWEWAACISGAIDAARQRPEVDGRAPVRIMGLSEGAITAARLARERPDVSHIAFISGFGCDQWRDMLVIARRSAPNPAEALAAVARTEVGLRDIAYNPADPNRFFEGQTYVFWSTFGRACPAADLAAASADVLVAYGTADEQIDPDGVEAIPAARIAVGKPVTMRRIVGGDHVLNTPGSAPFANLLGVFAESLDWMEVAR